MKKIKVPDGMLAAAREVMWPDRLATGYEHQNLESALKAAITWLADNPTEPSLEQVGYMYDAFRGSHVEALQYIATHWQRRMFLAPEPEDTDLIALANKLIDNPNWRSTDLYHILLKAFRMGEGAAIKTAVEGLREALEPKTEPEPKMGDS